MIKQIGMICGKLEQYHCWLWQSQKKVSETGLCDWWRTLQVWSQPRLHRRIRIHVAQLVHISSWHTFDFLRIIVISYVISTWSLIFYHLTCILRYCFLRQKKIRMTYILDQCNYHNDNSTWACLTKPILDWTCKGNVGTLCRACSHSSRPWPATAGVMWHWQHKCLVISVSWLAN